MATSTDSACKEWTVMLHGYLDNELDLIHTMELEEHLLQCAACVSELERLKDVKRLLGDRQARWSAPETVRLHILQAMKDDNAHSRHRDFESRSSAWRRLAGLVRTWGLIPSAAALAASVFLFLSVPGTNSLLQDQVLSNHVRSMLADHLVDVQTSDQHTVKPWFNGKLDFSPPVVDLTAEGFPLIGGRVDYLANRTVAALVYRRHGHVINVFVWPTAAATRHMATAQDGYNIEEWSAEGLSLWAVSDVSPSDLASFRGLFSAHAGL